MVRHLLVACALLLVASRSAIAQQHPCDIPSEPVTTTQKSLKVGFCHPQQDISGDLTTLIRARIFLNGTLVATWENEAGLLPVILTPNAAGLYYFETPPIPVSKGNRVLTVTVADVDGESLPGAPYSFTVKGPGPKVVLSTRIK